MHEALEHGDEAEAKHVDAEPDMGLELLEEDVGRDLEEDVGHEEYDERVVVQCAVQLELF